MSGERSEVLIGLNRKVTPTLVAADIVGVQPMNAPTGEVFTLRFVRESWWTRLRRRISTWWHEKIRGQVFLRGGICGPLPCTHPGVWVKKEDAQRYVNDYWKDG